MPCDPSFAADHVTIRPARAGDAAAIASLIRELAEYERLTHVCHITDELLEQHLFGPRPAAEVLVAQLDDAEGASIVGYALYFSSYSTFTGRPGLYLEDLYVQLAHRRRGIGRRLLQAVAAIAHERQCGRLEWTVLDWNTPSIAFYQSLGAVPLDDWTIFRLSGDALAQAARPNPTS
jgi:GNAT superfamily N-acetyltransferase